MAGIDSAPVPATVRLPPLATGGWPMDPNPDYDASDEIEYFFSWLPWALRGAYPPPAYPPV